MKKFLIVAIAIRVADDADNAMEEMEKVDIKVNGSDNYEVEDFYIDEV